MANYFLGDIQGCFDELQLLLQQAAFDPSKDLLWFTGDLVARGPKSLETLRFIKGLGAAARVVLGNHDLHLLAVVHGIHQAKPSDRLAPLLDAQDLAELCDWLRQQPLAIKHPDYPILVSHAGLYPGWSAKQAVKLSNEVSEQLRGDDYRTLLQKMYGNQPDSWDEQLSGYKRLRFIINAFTRMRYCYTDGRLDFDSKLAPDSVEGTPLQPWFTLDNPALRKRSVIFGHWAALMGKTNCQQAIALDTGCVWGNYLSMLRWEDGKIFTQQSVEGARG
ncbi:symmetrical bis(5'-nucleosyl)-tetraphosphatase [Aliagarivorans taiwanensis]|uniref:symmetrical bis(5'-nucleosyl)-tetraphosphatase n=1 Tax=Aliagarivorans taiwanensis TaxID=561966 RepID=UPI000402A6AA|nr:symmetrical bis(5'-nucleosyl)-tetraphosphatase [Aliagarivorans taiwanensis]